MKKFDWKYYLGLATLLFGVLVCVVLSSGPAFAAETVSHDWKWVPRGDASDGGMTTIYARPYPSAAVLPSGTPTYTVFRASNANTRFYYRGPSGRLTRRDRDRFFEAIRGGPLPQGIAVRWSWRTNPAGTRYRYAESVVAYRLHGSNTIAFFGDSLMETRYLDAAQNPDSPRIPAWYDGRLHTVVRAKLESEYAIRASAQNWSVGGQDSRRALRKGNRVFNALTGIEERAKVSPWADMLAARPDVVVLNFGATDVSRKIPVPEFRRNIATMVRQAQARGVIVVLTTCLAYDYPDHFMYDRNAQIDPYSDAIESVAQEYGVVLADHRSVFRASYEVGIWDFMGRRDASYFPQWDTGAEPGTVEWETQHHPWIGGVDLMAETIAASVVRAIDESPSLSATGWRATPWWLPSTRGTLFPAPLPDWPTPAP